MHAKSEIKHVATGRASHLTAGKSTPGAIPATQVRQALRNLTVAIAAFLCILPAANFAASDVPGITAFAKGSCILFQGDSITDGNRGRNSDPNHVLGHGYVFLIAAKYGAAFPEQELLFVNRGVSGNKVSDLAARWQKDCIDLKPDLLSLLIGVNDNAVGVSIADFEKGYDRLLADALAANPKLKLVLCSPFTLPVGPKKPDYERWNAGIRQRQEAVARLASKYNAALVQLQPVFEAACKRAPAEYWIWDGIHPTYAGHQLVADEWVRTVREFWPQQ